MQSFFLLNRNAGELHRITPPPPLSVSQTVLISGKSVTSRFVGQPVPLVSAVLLHYWTRWESRGSQCGNPCWMESP